MSEVPDPPAHGPRFVSNCLLYALGRFRREGGYLVMRRARGAAGVHFLWSPDLVEFWHFRPSRLSRLRKLFPLWRGSVKRGDGPDDKGRAI